MPASRPGCSRPGRLLSAGPVAPGRPIGQARQAPPQAGTPMMAAPAPPPHPFPPPTIPPNPSHQSSMSMLPEETTGPPAPESPAF